MTKQELHDLVKSIDPINAEYIIADSVVLREFNVLNRFKDESIPLGYKLSGDEQERRKSIIEMCHRDLAKKIAKFGDERLTPANVKVGDGATVLLWSDYHAGTIVKVTKATITIRRDKATLDPNFKPEFIPGGFAAHCTNQNEQRWSYEPNENGHLTTLHWSKKYNRYGTPGNPSAIKGRHEFYDYNF